MFIVYRDPYQILQWILMAFPTPALSAEFYVYKIILLEKKKRSIFILPILKWTVFFSYAIFRTAKTTLNNTGDGGTPACFWF